MQGIRAWLRERASALRLPMAFGQGEATGRRPRAPMAPLPPAGPGGWFAQEAPDGSWRIRDTEGGPWHRLDGRSFGEFRVQVADAGSIMLAVQLRQENGRLVEIRHRTVGHSLDGDRRDCPAIRRRCDRWIEYFYYTAGNPRGHERMSLAYLDRSRFDQGLDHAVSAFPWPASAKEGARDARDIARAA